MSERRDDLATLFDRRGAPSVVARWAAQFDTIEQAWAACAAPDWLLWMLRTFGFEDDRALRAFAALCARRAARLWDDPAGTRAIEVAERAAAGQAGAAEIAAARDAVAAARARIPSRSDCSEPMLAAACAAVGCVRDLATEAAFEASSESARAAFWDPGSPGSWPEEGVWQARELRRLVAGGIEPLFASVRRAARSKLPLL